jgi:cell division protease FtsH
MTPPRKSFSLLAFLLIFLVFLFIQNTIVEKHFSNNDPKPISYTEFAGLIEARDSDIKEVQIQDNNVLLIKNDNSKFTTYGPLSEQQQKRLVERGIVVNFVPPHQPSILFQLFMAIFPMIIFAFLLVWIVGKMQSSAGKGMSLFGKSKILVAGDDNKITFRDVAGVDEAREELIEVVEFLKDPGQFTKLGAKIPKGILLVGSPGNGKTLLAKATANEADVPFFSCDASSFVEMFVGVGASRVRDLFEQARKNAPCIVFIDEIDAVGRHRGSGLGGGGHDEREQTLNQLLIEMDGFATNEGVIVMAATNRVDVLDAALLRPGRFDRQVHVSMPDIKGRLGILRIHSRKKPLDSTVNLETIAKGTSGFSGADLESLVNEAAILAAREKSQVITNKHLELAKDKISMGPTRKSMVISEESKKTTAYHEIGHALVAKFTKGADPVHKVTIIPRGQALGVTMLISEEDKLTISKDQAQAIIDYAMGGRAAEELVFGQLTTGASDDIKKATQIARRMVTEWGMGTLGPINLSTSDTGRDLSKYHSESFLEAVDKEVRDVVSSGYSRAYRILNTHRELLEKLSLSLLEKETLTGEEMDIIIKEYQDGSTISGI